MEAERRTNKTINFKLNEVSENKDEQDEEHGVVAAVVVAVVVAVLVLAVVEKTTQEDEGIGTRGWLNIQYSKDK